MTVSAMQLLESRKCMHKLYMYLYNYSLAGSGSGSGTGTFVHARTGEWALNVDFKNHLISPHYFLSHCIIKNP